MVSWGEGTFHCFVLVFFFFFSATLPLVCMCVVESVRVVLVRDVVLVQY